MRSDEDYIVRALRWGASGYEKDAAVVELKLALKSVGRGNIFLGPPISRTVVDKYLKREADIQSPSQQLTRRQHEIPQAIAEGKTTRQIA
jgi:DNA-binding NarL/FixJ family response regulator